MLLKKPAVQQFFESKDFDEMLVKVGADDIKSYRDQYKWLHVHPQSALLFEKPKETWGEIKSVYNSTFKELVIGDLPQDDDVFNDLIKVSNRIAKVEWPH